jgi:hypothetical protein
MRKIPNSLYTTDNTPREEHVDSISNKEDEEEDNDIKWGEICYKGKY